jgi:hypothetical protein
MLICRVGHDELVTRRAVLEEVKNPLFFHQPAREIEIGFPVLDAIITRMIVIKQFVGDL